MQDEDSVREGLRRQIDKDPEGVIDMIVGLIKKVEQLTNRVSHLEGRLAKNSSNSSKPPSSDQKKKPDPKSRRKKGAKKNGGQKGHKGSTLNQSEAPDHIHDITLERCPLTGEKFDESNIVNVLIRQVFELPKQALDVHEYRIHQYVNSNGDIVSAKAPEGVNAPVQYGKNFKRWLVYMNDYQLIPLNRIQIMSMDFFGVKVSEQMILNARSECYDKLSNFDSELKSALIQSFIVHADETGFSINGLNHWLHVACSASLTHYGVTVGRGYDSMNEIGILQNIEGIMVHDCYPSYFRFDSDHVLCNPHFIRELVFAEEHLNQTWAKQMRELLEDAYNWHRGEDHLIKKFHRKYRKIIKLGYKEAPPPEIPKVKKQGRVAKSKERNLLERMDKYSENITRFLESPDIPFSNNQAEQDVRMMKVKQKISGGFRTQEGAKIFARIRSYLSTASKNGCSAWDSLIAIGSSNMLSPLTL